MSVIHVELYRKIKALIPKLEEIEAGEGVKLTSKGYMDLSVDVLLKTKDKIIISFAHNYKQNGDVVPDPDMEIAIYPNKKLAEALTFQDMYGYREVYPSAGMVDIKAKQSLNSFLNTWLNNLKLQGHKLDSHQGNEKSL